ncbi:MAG: glucokinase [Deltaproteobacteria bacterium]|nr:glucokinase [Deltaproteobacteria bacterium]
MILAGDIGGTKTVLALFDLAGGELRRLRDATFSSRRYESFDAILEEFLRDALAPRLAGACFGVAGRVERGSVRATNLPWSLDEQALARVLATPRVTLINDLQAAAYGMLFLDPAELAILQSGTARPDEEDDEGNIAVIAPGTGLGEAILYWDGERYHPIASEGGHSDFAPRTDLEIELLKYLRAALGGHVSYERVLAGDGIWNLYSFLRDTGGQPEPEWLRRRLEADDRNAAITQLGLSGDHPLCVGALDLFCTILGAEAANLALKCLAAGVIIGGGIAPKIVPALRTSKFTDAFADKGRFSRWLGEIPVKVALNTQAPLIGAARSLVGPAPVGGRREQRGKEDE